MFLKLTHFLLLVDASLTRNLSVLAIIEMNNFVALAGSNTGVVRRTGWQFIRLKPAVHGNYQTKRTENSTGRESMYINSFCSTTRRRKAKFGPLFFFSEPFVFRHLSFRNSLLDSVLNSLHLHNVFLYVSSFCHLEMQDQ